MTTDRKAATSSTTALPPDTRIEPQTETDGWTIMNTLKRVADVGKTSSSVAVSGTGSRVYENEDVFGDVRSDDELLEDEPRHVVRGASVIQQRELHGDIGDAGYNRQERGNEAVYKVYKRRWFGLMQLVLMNIIVSWDWLTFAAVSNTSSQYFLLPLYSINWLSTAFLFSFVLAAPLTIYTLHSGGPRLAILTSSLLLLVGNWIRYGGTRSNNYAVVMFGQILTGLAQPFVLSAPTRYSELWFTGNGRVAATAVMSLANPFGGALGQLIGPFLATEPEHIPNMVLIVTIISSLATIPSIFIPSHPPTPPAPSSTNATAQTRPRLKQSLLTLLTIPEFYLITIPYAVYVALFNSLSSLITQILTPYSFSETESGIAGALLILTGLIFAALTSPLIDRSKRHLLAIKSLIPILGLCYLIFIWIVPNTGPIGVYITLAILGAASFGLVPIVLEFLVEITWPVPAEITSTLCWTGGQLLGGIFVVVETALTDDAMASPPFNMQRALWFQGIMALMAVPLPLVLGLWGREERVVMKRVRADEGDGTVRIEE